MGESTRGVLRGDGSIKWDKNPPPELIGGQEPFKAITRFARATGHDSYQLSYVTYRDTPNKPEFYDFLLGLSSAAVHSPKILWETGGILGMKKGRAPQPNA